MKGEIKAYTVVIDGYRVVIYGTSLAEAMKEYRDNNGWSLIIGICRWYRFLKFYTFYFFRIKYSSFNDNVNFI